MLQKCEVWKKMEKVIKILWHDYFTLCKSAKVEDFQSIKAFHPTTENAANVTSDSHALSWFIFKVISVKLQKQKIYLVTFNFLSLQKALR